MAEGLAARDELGGSVSTAGDLNGDGKADLVLGAYNANPGGRTSAGKAYIIFGQASGISAAFNLSTLDGSNGFKVEGLAGGNSLGNAVSTAGDLNGDGKADLVLGAPTGRSSAGIAYVLYGINASQSASPSAISSIMPAPTPATPITSPSAAAPMTQTLGIALGVGGVVLLGGLVVVLVVFKQKKMACFSNTPKRRRDSVQSVKLKAYA